MSAISNVIAKPGYASLTFDANGFPASRAQFELILLNLWNTVSSGSLDGPHVTPTTEDLQRLYDGIAPANGDPAAAISPYLPPIFVHEMFLESPTNPKWAAYISYQENIAQIVPTAETLAVVDNVHKAITGASVSNIILDQYKTLPVVLSSITKADGMIYELPSAGGLPPSDSINNALIEVYIGYFNRAPEAQGLNYWRGEIDSKINAGMSMDDSLSDIANQFWPAAQQFSAITGYTSGMSTFDFVAKTYSNVLGRPDAVTSDRGGIEFWVNKLDFGVIESRGGFITSLIDGAHAYINANPNDTVSVYVDSYLSNRTDVASFFAQDQYSGHLLGDDAVNAGIAALSTVTDNVVSVQAALEHIKTGDYIASIQLSGANSLQFQDMSSFAA